MRVDAKKNLLGLRPLWAVVLTRLLGECRVLLNHIARLLLFGSLAIPMTSPRRWVLYIHPARHSRTRTTTKDEDDSVGFGPALGTAHSRFRIRVSSRSAHRTSSYEARRRWYFLWSTS